jgi:hypothetical protein
MVSRTADRRQGEIAQDFGKQIEIFLAPHRIENWFTKRMQPSKCLHCTFTARLAAVAVGMAPVRPRAA